MSVFFCYAYAGFTGSLFRFTTHLVASNFAVSYAGSAYYGFDISYVYGIHTYVTSFSATEISAESIPYRETGVQMVSCFQYRLSSSKVLSQGLWQRSWSAALGIVSITGLRYESPRGFASSVA